MPERCRVLPLRPIVEGQPCLVVEERLDGELQGDLCRLWIDPSRGSLVMCCALFEKNNALRQQCEIEYDRSEDGLWLPVKLTAFSVSQFGDAYDAICAVRQSSVVNSDTQPETFALQFPPGGEWVTDAAGRREYFAVTDRMRPQSEFSKTIAGLSLRPEGPDPTVGAYRERRALRNSVGRVIGQMVTWPGILITLPAVFGVYASGRAGLRRVTRRKSDLRRLSADGG